MADEKMILHVTDDSFETDILKADKPVLIDFWATWCGPCRALGPIIEEIADRFKDQVKVSKINIDDNPKVTAQYGVMSIPTLILFKEGKPLDRLVGLVPRERLEEFIKKAL
ncbi:MAG TPA: thioredoxin [Syntrophales bacterium]|nr:thioredoxin [Syntrophales bacterium]